jgi:hypothetical protein
LLLFVFFSHSVLLHGPKCSSKLVCGLLIGSFWFDCSVSWLTGGLNVSIRSRAKLQQLDGGINKGANDNEEQVLQN